MLRVHWFSFTIHTNFLNFFQMIYENRFQKLFGELQELGHGGRGFKKIQNAVNGFKVYSCPLQGDYIHVEIPGTACDSITPESFCMLFEDLLWMQTQGIKFKVKRLDIAYDNLDFSPGEVFEAIKNEKMISLVKRETIVFIQSPWEKQENGEEGTSSLTIGSRSSQRLVRIYDLHGFNRLEFQTRDERAQVVATHLFSSCYGDWNKVGLGHIRQFIEFDVEWWKDFTKETQRYTIKISSPRIMSINKMDTWLKKQISVALYVMDELSGLEYRKEIINHGALKFSKMKNNSKYKLILGVM